ncbi:MAG: hypothetical protein FWH27_07315 [Planctomycetaceae bacterium]|nr:hypothetical protein [Planctomycetaceae bacterium]
MKKMMSVCFAFMFLLAIVAGCPQPQSGDSKPANGSSSVESFDSPEDSMSMTSSDELTDDTIEF